jgi:hypothetical protein
LIADSLTPCLLCLLCLCFFCVQFRSTPRSHATKRLRFFTLKRHQFTSTNKTFHLFSHYWLFMICIYTAESGNKALLLHTHKVLLRDVEKIRERGKFDPTIYMPKTTKSQGAWVMVSNAAACAFVRRRLAKVVLRDSHFFSRLLPPQHHNHTSKTGITTCTPRNVRRNHPTTSGNVAARRP